MRFTDATPPGEGNYVDGQAVTRKVGDELNMARISVPRQYLMTKPAATNTDGTVRDWKVMLTLEAKEYLTLEGKIGVVNKKGQLRRLLVVPSDDAGEALEEDARDAAQRRQRDTRTAEMTRQRQAAAAHAQQRAAAAKQERKERTVKITYDINDYFFEKCKQPDGLQGAIEGIKRRARDMLGAPKYERADISVHQGLVDGIYPDSVIVTYITLTREDAKTREEIPWKEMKYIFAGTRMQLKAFMSVAQTQELKIAKCCFYPAAKCFKSTAGRPCSNPQGKSQAQQTRERKRTREEEAEQDMHARQLNHEKEAFAMMCANYVSGNVRLSRPPRTRGGAGRGGESRRHTHPVAVSHCGMPVGGSAGRAPWPSLRRATHPMLLDKGGAMPAGRHVFLHGLRPPRFVGGRLLEGAAHCQPRGARVLPGVARSETARGGHGTRRGNEGGTREGAAHGLCVRGLRFLCFLVGCVAETRPHWTGGWVREQDMCVTLPKRQVRREANAASQGSRRYVTPPGSTAAQSQGGEGTSTGGWAAPQSTREGRVHAECADGMTKKQRSRTDASAPLRAFSSYTGVRLRALPDSLCPD